jgi:hypothetical protein
MLAVLLKWGRESALPLLLALTWAGSAQTSMPPLAHFGSTALLKWTAKTKVPSYPSESVKANVTGLAVADLKIDQHGRVTSVAVDRAPDEAIRKAVSNAMFAWSFREAKIRGVAHRMEGRVFVYFRIEEGVPRVIVAGLNDR